jgi:hypothetical protein
MKKNKIIICMTAIPSRINLIEPVINSLISQCVTPDKIYINVPVEYKRFKEKIKEPKFINEKYKDMVEFFYLDNDYGPATKFIGSLLNNKISKNDLVVITDDDVVKVNNWLRMLLSNHEKNRITGFVEKQLGESIIWGYLGYVFRKGLLNVKDIIKFYSKVYTECFLVDDHWFTGYCHYRKIPIYNIPIVTYSVINSNFEHGGSNDSLVNMAGNNSRATASNKCRKIIKREFNTEFPFWCCLGCCSNGHRIEGFKNSHSSKNLFLVYMGVFLLYYFVIKYLKIKKENLLILSSTGFLLYKSMSTQKNNIEKFTNEIPKVIVQTYYNKFKIPEKVFSNIKKYSPNYKHIIFDDNECVNFLKKHFSADVALTFDKLQGAHKADLFRYCYLYKFGGIYLDIKTELIKPIDQIIVNNFTYSVLSVVENTIYQGIIATCPGNPVFLKLINYMVNLVKTNKPYHYLVFTIDCYDKIKEECMETPKPGFNTNHNNNKFHYYLFQEVCTTNKNDCYDGLDKHKMCCFVYDKGEKIFKTRYADFPW